VHGGGLLAAAREFPAAPAPFIDLSTGINPHAWTMPALPPDCWTRLPEPEQEAALLAAAARAYGVADPSCIVAAPGTQILIGLLPLLLPGRDVAVLGPTYGEHALAWRRAGSVVREVAMPSGLIAPVCVLCRPNNPDGSMLPRGFLLALADRCAALGGRLVVDEAFADLEPDASLGDPLSHPGLLLLRSFGKTYGLAGLRLGFALADPALAARLRGVLGPWAVSGPAIAAGTAALADAPWREAMRARLAHDATRLDATLRAAGLEVIGGTRLFRLAAHDEAAAWYRRLGHAGILVRRFADHSRWLRLGIPPDEAAWARLCAALAVAEAPGRD